ncbi:hypothetical protein ACFL1B_01825 [Nanoarchaeota archaeon]
MSVQDKHYAVGSQLLTQAGVNYETPSEADRNPESTIAELYLAQLGNHEYSGKVSIGLGGLDPKMVYRRTIAGDVGTVIAERLPFIDAARQLVENYGADFAVRNLPFEKSDPLYGIAAWKGVEIRVDAMVPDPNTRPSRFAGLADLVGKLEASATEALALPGQAPAP